MTGIEIFEANEHDIQGVLNLYMQPDIDNGLSLSIEQTKSIFSKMKTYPFYKLYTAKEGDLIVGTFTLAILDNMAHLGSSSGLVEAVVVHENYRSKGVGKQMMEYAMERCREAKCYKMSLSSNIKRERAHSFYERLGFKKHGYSFLIEL